MKKSIILGVVILLVSVGIVVSQKNGTKTTVEVQENKVATTIFPLYDITQQIAGDEFEVILMLPSGASPHTFDPQPSLLKDLQGSQAVFAIGHGLDNWATPIAEAIDATVVTVDHDVNLRATVEEHEDHDDDHEEELGHEDDHGDEHDDESEEEHDHGPIDPHYWLSLHNAEQITMNIADKLSKLDTENTDIYMARAKVYVEEIEALEQELTQKTRSLSNKNIISLHDAWYYFAEDFGLNLVGTFEPSAGKEPTPQYIINLKEEVDEHNVSTLFMEPQLSQSSIKSFSNDNNLSIAVIDPLGGVEGRNSYLELMRYNVEQVVRALTQ